MKIRNSMKIAAAAAATAAMAVATAPTGLAAPTVAPFGAQLDLTAPTGNIAGWTIENLKPSSDTIPAPVSGQLWDATATVEAVRGDVTPIVSNLNARTADGQTYRALFNVPTPQGVNPSPLQQGNASTGKVYFDVVGPAPDSVVYNDVGQDHLIWAQ